MLDDDVSIDVLNLTVRTYNCLIAERIYTIGKLKSLDLSCLWKIPNLGKKSAFEINEALKEYDNKKLNAYTTSKDEIMNLLDEFIQDYIFHIDYRFDKVWDKADIIDCASNSILNIMNDSFGQINKELNELRTLIIENNNLLNSLKMS